MVQLKKYARFGMLFLSLVLAVVMFGENDFFGVVFTAIAVYYAFPERVEKFFKGLKPYDLEKDLDARLIGGVFRDLLVKAERLIRYEGYWRSAGSQMTPIDASASDKALIGIKNSLDKDEASKDWETSFRDFFKAVNSIGNHFSRLLTGIKNNQSKLVAPDLTRSETSFERLSAAAFSNDDHRFSIDASTDQIYFYGRNLLRQVGEADEVRVKLLEKNKEFVKHQRELLQNTSKDIEASDDSTAYNLTKSLREYFSADAMALEEVLSHLSPSPSQGEKDFLEFVNIKEAYRSLVSADKVDRAKADQVFSEAKKLILKNKIDL